MGAHRPSNSPLRRPPTPTTPTNSKTRFASDALHAWALAAMDASDEERTETEVAGRTANGAAAASNFRQSSPRAPLTRLPVRAGSNVSSETRTRLASKVGRAPPLPAVAARSAHAGPAPSLEESERAAVEAIIRSCAGSKQKTPSQGAAPASLSSPPVLRARAAAARLQVQALRRPRASPVESGAADAGKTGRGAMVRPAAAAEASATAGAETAAPAVGREPSWLLEAAETLRRTSDPPSPVAETPAATAAAVAAAPLLATEPAAAALVRAAPPLSPPAPPSARGSPPRRDACPPDGRTRRLLLLWLSVAALLLGATLSPSAPPPTPARLPLPALMLPPPALTLPESIPEVEVPGAGFVHRGPHAGEGAKRGVRGAALGWVLRRFLSSLCVTRHGPAGVHTAPRPRSTYCACRSYGQGPFLTYCA